MRDARLVRGAHDRVEPGSATGRLRGPLPPRRRERALGQPDRTARRLHGRDQSHPGGDMVPVPMKPKTTVRPRAFAYTLVALAFYASGCRRGGSRTAGARAGDPSAVVAKVEDAVITVADLEARINKQPPFVRARYAGTAKKRELVDELVQHEVLAAEAARRGFDKDPDIQWIVKKQMISKLMQQDLEARLKIEDVPDADVEKYYNEHTADFHQKDAAGVRAIFLKSKGTADQAYTRAQALPRGPASLEEQQERFQELVAKYSDVPESKSRAADLLFFYADSTVVPKPIVEAAFNLKTVGDLAPPIKTDQGWAVILLTQKRPGFNRPLPEVKQEIRERLFRDRRTKAMESFVEDLKKKSAITTNDANLSKIVVEAGPGQPPGLTFPGLLGPPISAPPPGPPAARPVGIQPSGSAQAPARP